MIDQSGSGSSSGLAEDLSKDDTGGQDQNNALDSAISKVQSYIANPSLVTPQTLQELLSDLMDYKDEEGQEPQDQEQKSHGLSIMIGGKQ